MSYEDNYATIFRGILSKVIDQAPRGLRQQDMGHLHHFLETGETAGSFSAMFIRSGTDVKLSVSFDTAGVKTDEDGNEWAQFDVHVLVNWPTHGSIMPGVCLSRLDFYREVALFAAEIQAEFPAQVQRMMLTAQEVRNIRLDQQLSKIVSPHTKLKVGEALVLQLTGVLEHEGERADEVLTRGPDAVTRSLPEGNHEVIVGLRKYNVRVSRDVGVAINRVA